MFRYAISVMLKVGQMSSSKLIKFHKTLSNEIKENGLKFDVNFLSFARHRLKINMTFV